MDIKTKRIGALLIGLIVIASMVMPSALANNDVETVTGVNANTDAGFMLGNGFIAWEVANAYQTGNCDWYCMLTIAAAVLAIISFLGLTAGTSIPVAMAAY